MYKILLATKNSDKVKYFKRRLELDFPYEVLSLTEAGFSFDIEEKGSALERAEQKAREAFKLIGKNSFDCIVGQDDIIVINGKMIEEVKTIIPDLLKGAILEDGDVAYFHQAFYLMDNCGVEIAKLTLVEPCQYKKYIGSITDYSGYVLDKVFRLLDKKELERIPQLPKNHYFEKDFKKQLSNLLSKKV